MTVMTISAPTEAPCGKPTMSGEPSGLRVSDWKTAPESAERDADQDRAEHARQPQVADDELRARVAAARQRADHVARRDRELARSDRDHRQREQSTREDRADARPAAGARAARRPADAPRAVAVDAALTGAAIRLRRTSAMNTGVPSTAIITPAGSSLGRTITRPITSATSSSAAPSTAE